MSDPLLALVVGVLEQLGARYALFGAGALAVHGVARSTFDLDLLTTNRAVLNAAAWAGLTAAARAQVAIRPGDTEDPLAGVVRVEAPGERAVDIVVGRWAWQEQAIGRARAVPVAGLQMPVVTAADLILLKLYAGGSQDLWDIDQLLAGPERSALAAEVSSRMHHLPDDARRVWARLLEKT